MVKDNTRDIQNAASDAIRAISEAASKATAVIAQAAETAAKVVSNNAETQAKVVAAPNAQHANDHDLIVKLDNKVDSLKDDIRELKDGTSTQIGDHETRIRLLETKIWIMTGGLVILSFVTPYVFNLLSK